MEKDLNTYIYQASLVALMVKNFPARQETWVRSLGGEDTLEKVMATHSSILAWRIPRTEEPGGLWSIGCKESDTTERLSIASGAGQGHQETEYVQKRDDEPSQSLVSDSADPWAAARQASLPIISSWSLLRLMSIESAMPSNHLILCPPLSSCLQSFPASGSFPMSQFFTSGG